MVHVGLNIRTNRVLSLGVPDLGEGRVGFGA